MKRLVRKTTRRNPEAGITLIEVLVAGVVLVVGFMALFGLLITAIASNNRNKLDSTGTMLAQAVVENISSVLVSPGINSLTADCTGNKCLYKMTDCNGTIWNIDGAVGGVALSGSQIDFSQATPPENYYMDYVVCNADVQTKYDVRWNVQAVRGTTYLITVGVKKKNQTQDGGRDFALPVTLRMLVADQ